MAIKSGVDDIIQELIKQGAKVEIISAEKVAETSDFIHKRMEIDAQDYARKEAESEIAARDSYITT